MFTRLIVAGVLSTASLLFFQQDQEPKFDSGAGEPASVTQRYREEIESRATGQEVGEILASLRSLTSEVSLLTDSMVTVSQVEQMVDTKISTSKFVSMQDVQEVVDEAKKVASEMQTKAESEGCDCAAKFVEIFQRLEALENATGLTTAMYGGVSSTTTGTRASGGSTGSYTQTSYQTQNSGGSAGGYVQTSYAQNFAPAETRTVRVVEPFKRRQVSTVEVPVQQPVELTMSTPVDTGTCTLRDPITGECLSNNQAAVSYSAPVTTSKRTGLLGRVFGR